MPRLMDRQPALRLLEKAIATKYRARQFFVAASAAIAVTAGFLLAAQPAAAANQPGLGGGASLRLFEIQPGGHPAPHIATPVNIVFVGYQPKAVDVHRILGQLPAQGDPIVRTDQAFGLSGTSPDVGLRYAYRYRVQFASSAFDDVFFGYLSSIAIVGPIDHYQELYNEQQHNDLDVGPTTAYIDANSTEARLEQQYRRRLGIAADEALSFW